MAVFDARPSAFTQLTTTGEWEAFMSAATIRDGVDGQGSLVPSLDIPGRNAVLGAGNAIVKGQLWRCDSPVSTPIPAASAQNRIDRLTLRLNRAATTAPTVVQPFIIQGTPSGSPTEPALVQTTTGIWDIPMSSWQTASSGAVSALNDERVLIGAQEVPHSLTPFLINGWSIRAGFLGDYYMISQSILHIDFELNCSARSGNSIISTALPPIYWPLHPQDAPIGWYASGGVGSASPALGYFTNGVLTAYNLPSGTTLIQFSGDMPLY